MKKLIIIGITFVLLAFQWNNILYVKSDGIYRSYWGIWATYDLEDLDSLIAAADPNDAFYFHRGDSFDITITIANSGTSGSPIVLGACGATSKAMPLIYGSDVITGWTLHSGNIYKATVTDSINQIFLDGSKMMASRTPNTSYHDVTGVTSTTTFTSTDLSGAIDYTGAYCTIRTNRWRLKTLPVVSSTSNTLTLSEAPRYTIDIGDGFFLTNKLEFLDEAGEWYYDGATNTVYLWTPNGDSPANYTVRGSVRADGIYVATNSNYITIRDLDIRHNMVNGIHTYYSDNITIEDNNIYYPDAKGVFLDYGSEYSTIDNNTIEGINHYGIHARQSYNTISNNSISEIGLFDNLGLTGAGNGDDGMGIYAGNGYNTVQYNRIVNSGYNGIAFDGHDNIIEYNFIKDVNLVRDDGGAIYTWTGDYVTPDNSGSIIRNNIIDGAHAPSEGSNSTYNSSIGIYTDLHGGGVTIENNTLKNISGAGVFMSRGKLNTVTGNTVFDAQFMVYIAYDDSFHTITNNIGYATDGNEGLVRVLDIDQSHIFDNNTYVSHYATEMFNDYGVTTYDFEGWKTFISQDANSTIDVSSLGAGETDTIFYNDTKTTQVYDLSGATYTDISGVVKTSLTLGKFESEIFTVE